MQQFGGTNEGRGTAATIDAILEREMRAANRLHELVADNGQCRNSRLICQRIAQPLLDASLARHSMPARRLSRLRLIFGRIVRD